MSFTQQVTSSYLNRIGNETLDRKSITGLYCLTLDANSGLHLLWSSSVEERDWRFLSKIHANPFGPKMVIGIFIERVLVSLV